MTRAAELTDRLLDGILTEGEAAELAALVATDPVAASEHLSLIEMEAELRGLNDAFDVSAATLAEIEARQVERTAGAVMDAIASSPAPAWPSRPVEPAPPARRRRWGAVAAAVACAAALGVGVWVVSNPPPKLAVPADSGAFAKLARKSGDVEVLTPAGDAIAADEGADLPAGFTVRTGDDSLAVVELLREQARVEIEPDSVVRFDADTHTAANRPRLFLSAGQLTAAVTARPDARPLIVGTAVADVFARGATFVVSSAGPDSARVDITDGNVELVRARAPKPVAVAAGGAAVVSPGFGMDIERSPAVDRTPRRVLAAPGTRDAVFSPDGSEVWVGTAKAFGRWSATGALAEVGFYARKGGDGVAAFSRDKRFLLTFRGDRDDRVLVRTVPDGGEHAVVNVRPGESRFWVLAPDASWMAVTEPKPNQKRVRVVDVTTGDDRFVREFDDPPTALAASPDGGTLAVAVPSSARGVSNKVVMLDPRTSDRLYALSALKKPVTAMAFAPDGRTVAIGYNGAVQLWDVDTLELSRSITGFERPVTCLGFSPDGARVAAGTPDGRVWVWDVASGRPTQLIEVGRGVRGVGFSPDGRQLLTLAAQVAVWDVADPPNDAP